MSAESIIKTKKALRKIISKYPPILDKRIKSRLDPHCLEFIQHTRLAVLAVPSNHTTPFQFIDTQDPAQFEINSDIRLNLKTQTHYDRMAPISASLFFMSPGVSHGLRVNGKIILKIDGSVAFYIDQVYFHCGRATERGQLWQAQPRFNSGTESLLASEFLEVASYFLLATTSKDGFTQLSPRGDQAGLIQLINDGRTLIIPERPGNKVAISLRNIIEDPNVALCGIIPGSHQVLKVTGQAYLCQDETLLESCTVNQAIPKVAIAIDIENIIVESDKILEKLNLWNPDQTHTERTITPFEKVLSEHMIGTGYKSKITHLAVNRIIDSENRQLY